MDERGFKALGKCFPLLLHPDNGNIGDDGGGGGGDDDDDSFFFFFFLSFIKHFPGTVLRVYKQRFKKSSQ